MRLSGDGHIRNSRNITENRTIVTRRVVLSRSMALKNIDSRLLSKIKEHYKAKKDVNEYPSEIIHKIKNKMKDTINFPKEFLNLQRAMKLLFDINSLVYSAGLRSIYYDKKRKRYIISCKYRLVISRKDDIIKFHKNINFAECDKINRKKLINLIKSYN